MSTPEANDRALLVAMPLRHLVSARAIVDAEGAVALPAGGPGALDETPLGTPVLFIAVEGGDAEVPAATWAATFEGRLAHSAGDPLPDALPATWIDELDTSTEQDTDDPPPDVEDDEDEDDDDDLVGPQSFFLVRDLVPLPRTAWVFANELVPKQERGGRTFVPRTPRLIVRPD